MKITVRQKAGPRVTVAYRGSDPQLDLSGIDLRIVDPDEFRSLIYEVLTGFGIPGEWAEGYADESADLIVPMLDTPDKVNKVFGNFATLFLLQVAGSALGQFGLDMNFNMISSQIAVLQERIQILEEING